MMIIHHPAKFSWGDPAEITWKEGTTVHLNANLRSRRVEEGALPRDGHVELTFSLTQEVSPTALPTYADRVRFAEAVLRAAGLGQYMTDAFKWSVSVDIITSLEERQRNV